MQAQVDLWYSDGCEAWHAALSGYEDVVRAQGVSGLPELDTWYHSELPASIPSRDPAYITLDELAQVTRWKMKRGVWRQRNLLLVEGNPATLVQDVSRQAFAAAPDPRKSIALLSELSGVGAATASAVMAAHTPAVYPFFDELVAAQVPGLGPVAFTAAYYARYAEALRQRASALSETCPHGPWTVQEVSQALWSASGGKIALTPRRQDAEDAPSL